VLADSRAKSIEAGAGTNAEKIDLMANTIWRALGQGQAIRDQAKPEPTIKTP